MILIFLLSLFWDTIDGIWKYKQRRLPCHFTWRGAGGILAVLGVVWMLCHWPGAKCWEKIFFSWPKRAVEGCLVAFLFKDEWETVGGAWGLASNLATGIKWGHN